MHPAENHAGERAFGWRRRRQGSIGYVDGIAERLRPGQPREAVIVAWGIGEDGREVLPSPHGRIREEDTETVRAFFQDMRARGLGDPLLVVSDGAPGVIRAIEECFPRSARQRCLAHRMRNLAVKVPTDLWPEFKARVTACYQAPSRAIARELAVGIRADYASTLPSAVACFEDDFAAAIAHLRAAGHASPCHPVPTNLLERLFVEERRRLKIIPNGFGEKAVLKLMFGALIRAAERWRGLRSPNSSFVRSPPSDRISTPNTRPASPSQTGHLNSAFPANPRLDRRVARPARSELARRARVRHGGDGVVGKWEDTGKPLAPWEIRAAAALADLQFDDGRPPPRP